MLLLVRHQLGDFILSSGQLLLVVSELTNDEFLFTCMQLEFLNDFLEQCYVVEPEVLIFCDELRRAWHNHVSKLLVANIPVIGKSSRSQKLVELLAFVVGNLLWNDDQQRCQVFRIENEVIFLHQVGQVSCEQTSAKTEHEQ